MVQRFVVGVLLAVLGAGGAAVAVGAAPLRSPISAITHAQCDEHAVEGQVTICHRTKSSQHPFVQLSVSLQACYAGHGGHVGDYISDDGTCSGEPDEVSTH